MKIDELYLDIDSQGDLMLPDGGFYVQGAAAILPRIRGLIQHAGEHRQLVVSTMQTYAANSAEFEHLPLHCVDGTPGWSKVPVTLLNPHYFAEATRDASADWKSIASENAQIVVRKGTLAPFDDALMRVVFEQLAPKRVTIFGVTSDYGVIPSAEYLLDQGCEVRIIFDAMRGVSDDNASKAQGQLERRGAELASTADIIGSAHRRRPTSRSLANGRRKASKATQS